MSAGRTLLRVVALALCAIWLGLAAPVPLSAQTTGEGNDSGEEVDGERTETPAPAPEQGESEPETSGTETSEPETSGTETSEPETSGTETSEPETAPATSPPESSPSTSPPPPGVPTAGGAAEGPTPAGQNPIDPVGQTPGDPQTPPLATGIQSVHPTFSSEYDVNRNIKTWTNRLNVSVRTGALTVGNATSVSIGEDATRARDQLNNSNRTSIDYVFTPELKLTSALSIQRASTIDAGQTQSRNNADTFVGSVEYTPVLPARIGATIVGTGGTENSNRFQIANSLISERESSGPSARLTADFNRQARMLDWTVNTVLGTSSLDSQESSTGLLTKDRNIDNSLGFSAGLKVPGFKALNIAAARDYSQRQEPVSRGTQVSQESTTTLGRSATIGADVSPFRRLDLAARYGFSNNDVNRAVDLQRAQESTQHSFASELDYMFPDSTDVNAQFDWSKRRLVNDSQSRQFLDGDTESRSLSGRVERDLSSRSRIRASGNYEVQSYFFDAFPDTATDDRDVVRADFQSTFDYNPARKFVTSIRFVFRHDQTIFIDGTKSSANQTQQTFEINPSFRFRINERVIFTEDASAIANQRVFDFDENQNRLSRTTEFRSTIDAALVGRPSRPRLESSLRHVYRIVQDGTWRRPAPGLPRLFGRSSESTTSDLTVRFDYTPIQAGNMYFRVNRRFGSTISRVVRGGGFEDVESTNEYNEIEVGGRLTHTLQIGTGIGLNLRRVQNWNDRSTRNNYWVGEVSVTQTF